MGIGPNLRGKEVEVGLGAVLDALGHAAFQDGKDLGVRALAVQPDAAVGGAHDHTHAAARAAVLHHVQDLEGRLRAHHAQHQAILPEDRHSNSHYEAPTLEHYPAGCN